MNAKKASLLLVMLALAGSVVCFYATNLVLSDVSNMFYGAHDIYFISSIPAFIFAVELAGLTIYVLRRYLNPQCRKRMSLHYLTMLCILSFAGMFASVLTGTMVYRGFFTPYPFPCYTVISLALHAALTVFSISAMIRIRKTLPDDIQRVRIGLGYILYTIVLCLIVFYAYNRTGALLWALSYVQTSTLYLTAPFYLSLILPMLLVVHIYLYDFGVYEKHPGGDICAATVILILSAVLAAAVIHIGRGNTQFISAVSPAVAIERLLSKPIDTVLHFSLMLAAGTIALVYAIWRKASKDKDNKNENAGRA